LGGVGLVGLEEGLESADSESVREGHNLSDALVHCAFLNCAVALLNCAVALLNCSSTGANVGVASYNL
jgi:hypothetical protein